MDWTRVRIGDRCCRECGRRMTVAGPVPPGERDPELYDMCERCVALALARASVALNGAIGAEGADPERRRQAQRRRVQANLRRKKRSYEAQQALSRRRANWAGRL